MVSRARPSSISSAFDLLLTERRASGSFPEVAQLGAGSGAFERPGGISGSKRIVSASVDQIERAASHQARIAGPGPHEVDDSAHVSERYIAVDPPRFEQTVGRTAASRRARDSSHRARRAPRRRPPARRDPTVSRRAARRRRRTGAPRSSGGAWAPTGSGAGAEAQHGRSLGGEAGEGAAVRDCNRPLD